MAQPLGHELHVGAGEAQLLGDLPVREVQAHKVEAQHPDAQRLVMTGRRAPRIPKLADPSNPRSWYARSRTGAAATLMLTAPGIPMLPWPGLWHEVFNSDYSDHFPNRWVAGNAGGVRADGPAGHTYPHTGRVTIPANGAVVLAREP